MVLAITSMGSTYFSVRSLRYVYLFIYLFIYLSIYLFIYLCMYVFIYLFIYVCMYLFIHLYYFIYLFIHLFIYLFIYKIPSFFSSLHFQIRDFPRPSPSQELQFLSSNPLPPFPTFPSIFLLFICRYVIYPVQVLAKSCKPIPVMLMGAIMGKKYPLKKYVNVLIITAGVAMFMMGKQSNSSSSSSSSSKTKENASTAGAILLFISLCFDGGTGAYEDKLMAKHHVGPFDLMYNMHLGKAILAGIGLIVMGQINYFILMCHETGFLLLLLGVSGAFGQVFIFVTISKFGALTCSIMGLARKVVTLVASIYIYGHSLNGIQTLGLVVAFAAMISGFFERKGKGGGGSMSDGSGGREGGNGNSSMAALVERERREMLKLEAKPLLAAAEEEGEGEDEDEGGFGGGGRSRRGLRPNTVTV